MRLRNRKMIEHRQNVVGRAVLAIGRRILRYVRWRIAARGIGDGPVALPEMLKLLFPAAMIAGEFMDEDDRRAASGFLVIEPHAVIGGRKSHGLLRFQRRGNLPIGPPAIGSDDKPRVDFPAHPLNTSPSKKRKSQNTSK